MPFASYKLKHILYLKTVLYICFLNKIDLKKNCLYIFLYVSKILSGNLILTS